MQDDSFDDLEIAAGLRQALADTSPAPLLEIASTMAAMDGREAGLDAPEGFEKYDLQSLVCSMAEVASPETDALLLIWAKMLPDAQWITDAAGIPASRIRSLPTWLTRLDEFRPRKAVSVRGAMGEEETVILGIDGPHGGFTLMVCVDLLGNPYVDDAYVVPERIQKVLRRVSSLPSQGEQISVLNLSNVGANLTQMLAITDIMWPPIETESWPQTRPLLEWMLRLIPEGGVAEQRPDWTEEQRQSLVEDFLDSPRGSGLGGDVEFHAGFLVDMAADYGTGDPRQWSGKLVERVLTDLAPRKLAADKESLLDLPRTLRALVRYSHDLLGAPPAVTDHTLEDVRVFEPDYRALIESGGSGIVGAMNDMGFDFQAVAAALESGDTGAADEIFGQFVADYNRAIDEQMSEDEDDSYFRTLLVATAGGEEALAHVDVVPLPGEPLDLKGIEGDIAPRVVRVGDLVQDLAQRYFADQEMVTAALRTLRRVALGAPQVFRRRSSDEIGAAAICWIAAQNNLWFRQSDPTRTAKALAQAAGIKSSPAERAMSMLRACDDRDYLVNDVELGDLTLLTSARRARLIDMRDSLA